MTSPPVSPDSESTSESTSALGASDVGPEDDVPMSFFDHLTELRTRLIRSAFGMGAALTACYAGVDYLTQAILWPYAKAWHDVNARCVADAGVACLPDHGPQLQNLTAFESVLTDIRIALFGAIFLAAPYLFYQAWMFVAPGLYRSERRLVVPFVLTSAVMFLGGGIFCYLTVLPIATDFLLEYPLKKNIGEGVQIVTNYTYSEYVRYTTKLLLAFGLMFEFPLGIYFLARAGLITHLTLLRYWKPMVVSFFIVGAILTPPEPVTQILMALPMTGLFFVSIGIAYFVSKPELERMARLEAELAAEAEAEAEAEAAAEAAAARAEVEVAAEAPQSTDSVARIAREASEAAAEAATGVEPTDAPEPPGSGPDSGDPEKSSH